MLEQLVDEEPTGPGPEVAASARGPWPALRSLIARLWRGPVAVYGAEDADRARLARILNRVQLVAYVVLLPLVVAWLAGGAALHGVNYPLLVVINLAASRFLWRGHLRVAAALAVATMWAQSTFAILVAGGFDGSGPSSNLVVIILAGFLLSLRGALIMAAVSSLTVGALLLFHDPLGVASPPVDPWRLWYELTGLLILTAIVLHQALLHLRLTLEHSHRRQVAEAEARAALEQELREARRLETVGRLAGGVAHDFNNLLTVIRANIELLRLEPSDGPERERALDDVEHAASRATELTRELLAVGRRQMLQPQAVDLNALIRRLTTLLRALLGEPRRLAVALDAPHAWVSADPAQLERVIVNLVANARDAMPDGGVVTVGTADGGEEAVRLSVSDTGVGMEPVVAERIFEPFFTTKGPGRGVGLGLATVHGIVVQTGGSVRVETAPSRGATFHVRLPRAGSAQMAAVAARGGAAEAEPPRGVRLLVVEDEEPVRRIVVVALERGGHDVTAAASAEEALELWAASEVPFELLVTDLSLTGKSGAELATALRREVPELPVLYISGHAYEAQAAAAAHGGRAACLPKPFAPETLRRAVRALIDMADA